MGYKKWVVNFSLFILACPGIAQKKKIDDKKFFMDEQAGSDEAVNRHQKFIAGKNNA